MVRMDKETLWVGATCHEEPGSNTQDTLMTVPKHQPIKKPLLSIIHLSWMVQS